MKKYVSLILSLALGCSLLTGCMAMTTDTKIKADGTGEVTAFIGFTEEAIQMMDSMESSGSGSVTTNKNSEDMVPMEYNGVKYLGVKETKTFSSVEEFNKLANTVGKNIEENNANDMVYENIESSTGGLELTLKSNENGSFDLDMVYDNEKANDVSLEGQANVNMDGTEMYDTLMKDMYIVYTIEFPSEIKQVYGSEQGIKINDKVLEINFVEIGNQKDRVNWKFTTNPDIKIVNPASSTSIFSDVLKEQWFYNAVTSMANGGLVLGVGEGKFAPNNYLTYAQFCQILARAKGLEVGADESGYWAAKAIKSCVDLGYIPNKGEINAENYSVKINREDAVVAMYKAKQDTLDKVVKEVTLEDLPDINDVTEGNRENILNAFKYGITSGVDASMRFMPKDYLTRAQICQLFYNLDWCSII